MNNRNRTLMIGPSHKTRGGVTAVISSYTQQRDWWEKWGCYWLETQIDRNILFKAFYGLRALVRYPFLLPKFRIVHIHFSEPPGAIRKLPFLLIARLAGRKTILHFHSFSPETTIHGRFARLYKFMFNRADEIIVLSETWRKLVGGITRNPNINTVYNPVLRRERTPETANLRREPKVLFAGTLNDRKGFKDLILAFAAVHERHPDWRLVLAGNGEIEKAKELARQHGIEEKLTCTGWISGTDKDKVFYTSSIFCLPSYAEGFPMAVIDGISYGLPVIATPVGGLLDVFVPNEEVVVFPSGDIEKLAQSLELLMNSPEWGNNLARASLIKSNELFDLKRVTDHLDEIYEKLIPRKS